MEDLCDAVFDFAEDLAMVREWLHKNHGIDYEDMEDGYAIVYLENGHVIVDGVFDYLGEALDETVLMEKEAAPIIVSLREGERID